MNYVGRVLSSVKGFYNDINPATLTGAIDVLIVRQEDGTFVSSPWHVRFGKIGVMRAKQKVVDIEVNGEPVDLRMKLGEAGEAFFVQETDVDNATEMPGYLATSPLLSSLDLMEKGLQQMKAASDPAILSHPSHPLGTIPSIPPNTGSFDADSLTPIVENRGTIVSMSDNKPVVSAIPADSFPAAALTASTDDRPLRGLVGYPIAVPRTPTKQTVSTQTNVTGNVELLPPQETNFSQDVVSPFPAGSNANASASDAERRDDISAVSMAQMSELLVGKGAAVATETAAGAGSATSQRRHRRKKSRVIRPEEYFTPKTSMSSAPAGLSTTVMGGEGEVGGEEGLFEMELGRAGGDEDDENSLGLEIMSLRPPNEMSLRPPENTITCLFQMHDGSQASLVGRCVSLSTIVDAKSPSPWTPMRQFPSSFHSLTLSDVELTPVTSPIDSRPSSPKSDTEAIQDAMSQTQLTGDRFFHTDDILWKWGKLPVPPTLNSSTQLGSESHDKGGGKSAERTKASASASATALKKDHMLLLNGKKGGIYLDDIKQDEMDPELAALYLYGHHSASDEPLKTARDDDTESGNGQSLPQSPITVEPESGVKPAFSLSDVALSLCGGLEERESVRMAAQFESHRVTHDALCANPSILNDPNLVVRISDQYYSWSIAGPIFTSDIVFKQPLTEAALSALIKQHMPKKVAKDTYKRSWWGWGSRKAGGAGSTIDSAATIGKDAATSSPSSQASGSPESLQRNGDLQGTRAKYVGSELISSDEESEMPSVSAHRPSVDVDPALDSAGIVRTEYMKSLKLSSEQIAMLNLSEGLNEASFSVTTQYQGTARCTCFIFLWNWNDKIVVSDIDGTITKSDVLGQVLPIIGQVLPLIANDWSQVGIANLYSMIQSNGYRFLYLSARAIGQSRLTRDYLKGLRQGELSLPDGPLLLSPSSLASAFHREVIERKPEIFKISCLNDIKSLFPTIHNPFFAGFGNKINDVWAYRTVGVPQDRIFTVNHRGQLRIETLLSYQSSYTSLSDIVDHFFPPLPNTPTSVGGKSQCVEYNSFMFWRGSLPDLDDEIAAFVKKSEADKQNVKKAAVSKKSNIKAPIAAKKAASVKR